MRDIKVLILEDELLVAESLAEYLEDSGFSVCSIAANQRECRARIVKDKPDLVLVDIRLNGKRDGIDMATEIHGTHNLPFIFLTANTDPATIRRAMKTKPAAYISKPFNKTDLKIAIELACMNHNKRIFRRSLAVDPGNSTSLFVREGPLYKRIEMNAILYIEALGSYSVINTADKEFTLSYNLSYFSNRVSDSAFVKVHRSFIVNLDRVDAFDATSLVVNKKIIPVSKKYQKAVKERFLKL